MTRISRSGVLVMALCIAALGACSGASALTYEEYRTGIVKSIATPEPLTRCISKDSCITVHAETGAVFYCALSQVKKKQFGDCEQLRATGVVEYDANERALLNHTVAWPVPQGEKRSYWIRSRVELSGKTELPLSIVNVTDPHTTVEIALVALRGLGTDGMCAAATAESSDATDPLPVCGVPHNSSFPLLALRVRITYALGTHGTLRVDHFLFLADGAVREYSNSTQAVLVNVTRGAIKVAASLRGYAFCGSSGVNCPGAAAPGVTAAVRLAMYPSQKLGSDALEDMVKTLAQLNQSVTQLESNVIHLQKPCPPAVDATGAVVSAAPQTCGYWYHGDKVTKRVDIEVTLGQGPFAAATVDIALVPGPDAMYGWKIAGSVVLSLFSAVVFIAGVKFIRYMML